MSFNPSSIPSNRQFLRLGALSAFVGFALQLVASAEHPGHASPNESVAVFKEYAASDVWTVVHLGQFAGGLLVALALVFIARSLPRGGVAGGLALIGGSAAVIWAAVFAVQMAVDGFALKATIDAWIAAPSGDQAAALYVAEGVRAIEKGLSSLFHLMNGTALLTLGLAVALTRTYPSWLGWFGTAAGVGYILGGIATAHTGFSPQAGQILEAALIPGIVFLFGMAIAMWRAGDQPRIVAAPFAATASAAQS
jgi:hypothetical protein